MNNISVPLLVLVITQILFTLGNFIASRAMSELGFQLSTFSRTWFLIYLITRLIADLAVLYVFAEFSLGKMANLFAACSIILNNLISLLWLHQPISSFGYIGMSLAITSIILSSFK